MAELLFDHEDARRAMQELLRLASAKDKHAELFQVLAEWGKDPRIDARIASFAYVAGVCFYAAAIKVAKYDPDDESEENPSEDEVLEILHAFELAFEDELR